MNTTEITTAIHALLGPSSSAWWRTCTAGPSQVVGMADDGNDASRAGTAEHQVAGECLEFHRDPWAYLGRTYCFLPNRREAWEEGIKNPFEVMHRVMLDEEAIERVDGFVQYVRKLVRDTGGTLLVEKRVPIDHITGETGAGGTADVIILCPDGRVIIVDYKSGQVRVNAWEMVQPETVDIITGEVKPPVFEPNSQMAMYASGALRDYGWMSKFTSVTMIIYQPRLNNISEHTLTVQELDAFVDVLRKAADETRTNPQFRPSAETCQWCKARSTCKAREDMVLSTALDGFKSGDVQALIAAQPAAIDPNWLGACYDKLEMIQQWCKDVHQRVYTALQAGQTVINSQGIALKLVEGRAGNRYWKDEEAASRALLDMGVPDDKAFKRSVISPADAEKLAKAKKKGPPALLAASQWDALQQHIGQDPGKPVISLATDPKPAITLGFIDHGNNSISE